MALSGLLVVAAGIVLFAKVSKRLERTIITLPIVFVAFGWLIGKISFKVRGGRLSVGGPNFPFRTM